MACPRCLGGNTEVTIAICVAYSMAALIPCKKRAVIRNDPLLANDARSDVTMTLTVPIRKMRFRPTMSAIRPKTSTNIALAIKKAIGIQPSITASNFRSSAMAGNATLAADNIKGVVNAFNNTITNAARCNDTFSTGLSIIGFSYSEFTYIKIIISNFIYHPQSFHSQVL